MLHLKAQAQVRQFFLNGADTETEGVDLVADGTQKALGGTLDFTFAAKSQLKQMWLIYLRHQAVALRLFR